VARWAYGGGGGSIGGVLLAGVGRQAVAEAATNDTTSYKPVKRKRRRESEINHGFCSWE